MQTALRFRKEFNASRLGLLWKAHELTRRYRPRDGAGARFSERLITLTAPHVGKAAERVRWVRKAINGFTRKLREHRLRQLGKEKAALSMQARFFEWTDGDDGEGHPHWHIWDFGPFVAAELLSSWWHAAWKNASGKADAELLRVDVRIVNGVVEGTETRLDKELVKYLTKSWGGRARAFADVYGELVGKRARQTSARFASYAVALLDTCQDCLLVIDQTDVKWTREPVPGSALEALTARSPAPARAPPAAAGVVHSDVAGHLAEEWGERDFEWLESTESARARLRGRLRACYGCDTDHRNTAVSHGRKVEP